MHFLNLHVCPVVYRKDLFLALYSFSYILMICHKLSNGDDTCLVCQHKDINEIEKTTK